MPRVKLFAKLRGPLGWRKRAESEDLNEFNTFEMIVGQLDPEAKKVKDQEKDRLVRVVFAEGIDAKEFGLLHITLPEGCTIEYDKVHKAWTAQVNYIREGN